MRGGDPMGQAHRPLRRDPLIGFGILPARSERQPFPGWRSSFRGCIRLRHVYAARMPPNDTQRVAMTLEYPAEHRDRLRAIGAVLDRPVAYLIRQAIVEYLDTHDDNGVPR